MFLLIVGRDVIDVVYDTQHEVRDVVKCSNSVDNLIIYACNNFDLSEQDRYELLQYWSADDIFDKYHNCVNLYINEVEEI